MVRPVWPIWKRCGRQPASTAAREAPTAAPSTLASSSRIAKFSGPLSPRPPDTTISASLSSGSPVEASCRRSTSFMLSAGMVTDGFWTSGLAPACASAGRNTLGRSVAIHGVFDHVIFESSLPAYTGRVATSLPPSTAIAVESAESPAPRRAARRAMNSRCRVVTGAKIACGNSLLASSATAGVHTSARYGANAAFSSTHTRLTPHSPSCLIPSGVALSVTHTASTCAPACPASREASPSTSAITFLGAPCRSSSTMHQYAPAMSVASLVVGGLDGLGVFAQGADELLGGVGGFALDDAAGRARRQALELHDREHRRLGRDPDVGRLHFLDLLLLRAHDPLERRVARLV